VDVTGWVSAVELERSFRGATFLAAPSILEGFGFPPLEAMARGIPVACSAGGVWDETIGDAALRTPPTDVGGWTDALMTLASDAGLRSELTARGNPVAARMTWRETAADCWELYQGIR
jgi:glycosyltransferase involved in cell wall biosynthesis